MVKTKRVAIIGAGASGLCAVKHLLSSNENQSQIHFEPIIFEQQSVLGGTWVYEDLSKTKEGAESFSSIYKNLK